MRLQLYIALLYLLIINFGAFAQKSSFEFLLAHPNNEIFYDFAEDTNGNFTICNQIDFANNSNKHFVSLFLLNQNGLALDSNIISLPSENIAILELNQTSNGIIFSGLITDTNGFNRNARILAGRLNDELEIFDTVTFALPGEYSLGQVCSELCYDGNLLISGFIYINNQSPRAYVYELSPQFDSLKARFYFEESGIITRIKKFTDNTYWFINDIKNEYYIVDTNLNYQYSTKIPEHLVANFSVKWDTDSSFYLLGDKILPEPSHKIGFIKQYNPTNSTGHLFNQWRGASDTVDFPAVWGGIDFQYKDSVFICGTHNFALSNPFYGQQPSWFVVLQTDSMLNIRWERFYGGDAYYLMGKITATQDGGCLIGGTRYDYQNVMEQKTDVIILKLNEDGLLVDEQETPSIEMHEAIVYPNPGTTEIKVRIAAQYKESLFQLFDLNGKQVASEKMFGKFGSMKTEFLNPGTFIYRISSNDGLFESGKWVKQ